MAQPDPVSTPASTLARPVGPVLRAQAHLLDGEESDRAMHLLAARHPILHGRLVSWLSPEAPLDHPAVQARAAGFGRLGRAR